MKPHLSLSQYRIIDLLAFTFILTLVETLIALASSKWFPDQLYTVSAVAGVTAIVMVRWKWFGAIQAIAGALVLCVVFKSTPRQYLIYCVGNLFCLLGTLAVKFLKEEKMRKNILIAILYGVLVLFFMQTGRAVVSLILGYGFKNALGFYVTDSLSYIFTALILFVSSRQDGLLENQVHYIRRIQDAEKDKDL